MRTDARRDAIEAAIVVDLRTIGCSVWRLNDPGVPDLLVGRAKQTYLLEVKSPGGRLTKKQKTFHTFWRGAPPAIVHSTIEAFRAVGAI